MNRPTLRTLSMVFTAGLVSLSPVAANAQPATVAAGKWDRQVHATTVASHHWVQQVQPTDFTTDQVQAQFARQGFQVEAPITWWTSNHVTTFRVSDGSGEAANRGRVLMVMVYPDAATAQATRIAAQAAEESSAVDGPKALLADSGPHLIPGYGPSIWNQNVALVESTQEELARAYAAEQDRDNQVLIGGGGSVQKPRPEVTYAVDFDFVTVLEQGTVNL